MEKPQHREWNETGSSLRGYPGATDPWRSPNHRTVLQDFNTTSGWNPRLGSQERRGLQNVEVRRTSLSRWSGISPFRLRDMWPLGQTLPRLLCIDGTPGAAISMYWRRRISVTLHKTMAEGILARAARLNSKPTKVYIELWYRARDDGVGVMAAMKSESLDV